MGSEGWKGKQERRRGGPVRAAAGDPTHLHVELVVAQVQRGVDGLERLEVDRHLRRAPASSHAAGKAAAGRGHSAVASSPAAGNGRAMPACAHPTMKFRVVAPAADTSENRHLPPSKRTPSKRNTRHETAARGRYAGKPKIANQWESMQKQGALYDLRDRDSAISHNPRPRQSRSKQAPAATAAAAEATRAAGPRAGTCFSLPSSVRTVPQYSTSPLLGTRL